MSIPPEQVGAQETNGMGYFIWCPYPTDEQPVQIISIPPPSPDNRPTDYCSVWPLDNRLLTTDQQTIVVFDPWTIHIHVLFNWTDDFMQHDPPDMHDGVRWSPGQKQNSTVTPGQEWNDTVTPWTAMKWHSDPWTNKKFWDHPIHLWRGGGGYGHQME